MKYPYLLLIGAFVSTLFFSCKKSGSDSDNSGGSNNPPEYHLPYITSVNPEPLTSGANVTISGANFGTNLSKLSLKLDTSLMVVTSLTDKTITFTVPANYVKAGQTGCYVNLKVDTNAASRWVTTTFVEPHGWYYTTISGAYGDNTYKMITFPTDSIGFIQRNRYILRTTNGGITWGGVDGNGGLGLGNAFSSIDGKNAWAEFASQVAVATDGTSFRINNNISFDNSVIIGLYMSSPGYGLVATQAGKLHFIDGSFDAAHIYDTYASKYPSGDVSWRRMSAVDGINTMIAGSTLISSKRTLTIVHEKGGAFSEYDLGAVSTATDLKVLQLIDKNTAVLIDGNNDILKLTGDKNWIKLNQKATAVYFTDVNTGYAAYNGKLLKTTDGGATWKDEITLRADETLYSIYVKNGKIWAVGSDAKQGIILKYNP